MSKRRRGSGNVLLIFAGCELAMAIPPLAFNHSVARWIGADVITQTLMGFLVCDVLIIVSGLCLMTAITLRRMQAAPMQDRALGNAIMAHALIVATSLMVFFWVLR